MRFPSKTSFAPVRIITAVLGVLMASLLLAFGVGNLINPDVAAGYEDQNTRMCVTLIIAGLVSIYGVFRPCSGGIILCVCAVALGVLSRVFDNPISITLLLVGGLFVICGRLSRRAVSEEPDERS